MELVREQGECLAGVLTDLTKFYDSIGIDILVSYLLRHRFPLHLALCSILIYLSPRILCKHPPELTFCSLASDLLFWVL